MPKLTRTPASTPAQNTVGRAAEKIHDIPRLTRFRKSVDVGRVRVVGRPRSEVLGKLHDITSAERRIATVVRGTEECAYRRVDDVDDANTEMRRVVGSAFLRAGHDSRT